MANDEWRFQGRFGSLEDAEGEIHDAFPMLMSLAFLLTVPRFNLAAGFCAHCFFLLPPVLGGGSLPSATLWFSGREARFNRRMRRTARPVVWKAH